MERALGWQPELVLVSSACYAGSTGGPKYLVLSNVCRGLRPQSISCARDARGAAGGDAVLSSPESGHKGVLRRPQGCSRRPLRGRTLGCRVDVLEEDGWDPEVLPVQDLVRGPAAIDPSSHHEPLMLDAFVARALGWMASPQAVVGVGSPAPGRASPMQVSPPLDMAFFPPLRVVAVLAPVAQLLAVSSFAVGEVQVSFPTSPAPRRRQDGAALGFAAPCVVAAPDPGGPVLHSVQLRPSWEPGSQWGAKWIICWAPSAVTVGPRSGSRHSPVSLRATVLVSVPQAGGQRG